MGRRHLNYHRALWLTLPLILLVFCGCRVPVEQRVDVMTSRGYLYYDTLVYRE